MAACRGSHLLGVQPLGNLYQSHNGKRKLNVRDSGLGALAALSDELVLRVLQHCAAVTLVRASAASRALYCFCGHEDLWKHKTLERYAGSFSFQATWKDTYVHHAHTSDRPPPSGQGSSGLPSSTHPSACRRERRITVQAMYSDILFQPHLVAVFEPPGHWLDAGNLAHRTGLSRQEFLCDFEATSRPVVLKREEAFQRACGRWTPEFLAAVMADTDMIVGDMPMRGAAYWQYISRQHDDAPLYLFDKNFAAKLPQLHHDYTVPAVFPEDLFELLGEARPDYRWLLLGPARSGSTFHVDPNGTSAWNACVFGSKLWVLFPPGRPPPGVHASADGALVVTPLSVVEWFLSFFDDAREDPTTGCTWGVVNAGDVLYVPAGWWHSALNLELTAAVTQNYVSEATLLRVLRVLRTGSAELISGCGRDERGALHARFTEVLEKERPGLVDRCLHGGVAANRSDTCQGLAKCFGTVHDAPAESEQRQPFRFSFGGS